MNFMRRNLLALAGAAALAALGAGIGANPAQAQEVTLRMHQFLPAQANIPKYVLDVWADKIEAESKGRIKFQRFPSMQLGGTPPELIDQAIDGVADIVWTVAGYTPGRFPRAEVFELPFMMTNAEATSKAYWDSRRAKCSTQEFKDVHVIGVWVAWPGHHPLQGSDQDRRRPERRQAARPDPRHQHAVLVAWRDAGRHAGSRRAGSAVEGRDRRDRHAVGSHRPRSRSPNWSQPHRVPRRIALHASFIFAMNKAKYDSLPDDLKDVIDDNSGMEFSAFAGKIDAGK